MTVQEPQSCPIVLVDPLPLRRAAFARLLEDGVDGAPTGFRLVEPFSENCMPAEVRLVILSLGGASLRAPEQAARLSDLRSRLPDAPLVVLAENDGSPDVVAALRAGARGYMTVGMEPAVLFSALSFVAAGGCFFPPAALLAAQGREAGDGPLRSAPGQARLPHQDILTTRQSAVLRFLQQGHSNKQIARALGMNEATVKVHVRQIMRKLGVTNRTQAVLSALERGLGTEVPPGPADPEEDGEGALAAVAAEP